MEMVDEGTPVDDKERRQPQPDSEDIVIVDELELVNQKVVPSLERSITEPGNA